MPTIKTVRADEILDSRGNPTVETVITLDDGTQASAAVPSGASTGAFEAFEMRDEDAGRYGGKGVLKACEHVNTSIAKAIVGMNPEEQEAIDKTMIDLDGTDQKKNLGANAILSVSMASARAAALIQKKPLYQYLRDHFSFGEPVNFPSPLMNLINGGKHASTNIALQEFQIVFARADCDAQLEMGSEIFHALGGILEEHGLDTDVGNEGGYAPNVDSIEQVFEMFHEAIEAAGASVGGDVTLGIDAAANSFASGDVYEIAPPTERLSASQLGERYAAWAKKYQLTSIEDPFSEDAWDEWSSFTALYPELTVIGDDLFVTNVQRIQKGIDTKASNASLIKLNQIGTVSETIDAIKLSQDHAFKVIVSHRSGETNDAFIADLAVAVGADLLKAGAPSRGERVAKYNRLKAIWLETR